MIWKKFFSLGQYYHFYMIYKRVEVLFNEKISATVPELAKNVSRSLQINYERYLKICYEMNYPAASRRGIN